MFLRKDATKHLVLRVDELIRKTTIYAKIAFFNYFYKFIKMIQQYFQNGWRWRKRRNNLGNPL
ncbi:hypothetical protein [Neobacillus drentensis]|uniref:hypothetical protein n=1 Tax=Neobacillus drentensis TaxID=220684 RepID=UPI002FFFFA8F